MITNDTLIALIQIIVGFVLLFFGGDWLVNSGVTIARKFKISPLVVGMTIVAFGTSAPELLVSLTSTLKGNAGIAMGNVLGSNIANIGFILGVTAIIYPILTDNRKIITNGLIMLLSSVLLLVLSLNNGLSRAEGALLFISLVLFTWISIRRGNTEAENQVINDNTTNKEMATWVALLLALLSCAMLSFGADFLVDGATTLARNIGVNEKVIGLTIVAVGTSLPELAASVAAAFKREMDISIGNVIGSNIFNILCVLGVSTTISPISFDFDRYRADFIIMLSFSVALLLSIRPWKTDGRIGRVAGILMFGAYVLYFWTLYR